MTHVPGAPTAFAGPLSDWLSAVAPRIAAATDAAFCTPPHRVAGGVVAVGVPLAAVQQLLAALPAALITNVMPTFAPKRRLAFVAGRLCAERALRRLARAAGSGNAGPSDGASSSSVGRGVHGEPLWPAGVRGSITHTDYWAYAAVAPVRAVRGVGIDSEPIVDAGGCASIERLCCTAFERQRWLRGSDRQLAATVVFSAKEALYKALYPSVERWIDFDEVEVTALDWATGTARVEPVDGQRIGCEFQAAQCHFVLAGGALHASCAL